MFKYFPEILENQFRVYPSKEDFRKYFEGAGFTSVEEYEYNFERYQDPLQLIEAAEGKLLSMFRPISEEGLERGVSRIKEIWDGAPESALKG
ncbi:hypothetical protein KEJ47_00715 [Candidatus Bathyarchaeota archaeon]|nr:hypothetical protein [Candidatus Bathyarchaeota archaeon]